MVWGASEDSVSTTEHARIYADRIEVPKISVALVQGMKNRIHYNLWDSFHKKMECYVVSGASEDSVSTTNQPRITADRIKVQQISVALGKT